MKKLKTVNLLIYKTIIVSCVIHQIKCSIFKWKFTLKSEWRKHSPFKGFEQLAFVVSDTDWWAAEVFGTSKLTSGWRWAWSEVILTFWFAILPDVGFFKWAKVFNFGLGCLEKWVAFTTAFPRDFPEFLTKSWCLLGVLNELCSGWFPRVLDWGAVKSSEFSVLLLVVLRCEKLNGTGRVDAFLFVLPCKRKK